MQGSVQYRRRASASSLRARAGMVDLIVAVALVMFNEVLLCLIRIIYQNFEGLERSKGNMCGRLLVFPLKYTPIVCLPYRCRRSMPVKVNASAPTKDIQPHRQLWLSDNITIIEHYLMISEVLGLQTRTTSWVDDKYSPTPYTTTTASPPSTTHYHK